MSDSDHSDAPMETVKVKKPVSEAKKEACRKNVAKARAVRAATKDDRKKAKVEKEQLFQRLLDEKLQQEKKPDVAAKEVPVSSDSSSESEESESENDESDSSEDAEFVLTKVKATKSIENNARVSHSKQNRQKKSSIMEAFTRMEAEIAALKKEKKEKTKVNVYVNNEQKKPGLAEKIQKIII